MSMEGLSRRARRTIPSMARIRRLSGPAAPESFTAYSRNSRSTGPRPKTSSSNRNAPRVEFVPPMPALMNSKSTSGKRSRRMSYVKSLQPVIFVIEPPRKATRPWPVRRERLPAPVEPTTQFVERVPRVHRRPALTGHGGPGQQYRRR